MRFCRLLALLLIPAGAIAAPPFSPAGWIGYKTLVVTEPAGIARDNDPVDVSFSVPVSTSAAAASLRVVSESSTGLAEVPAQFYAVAADGGPYLSGRLVFLCPMRPNEKKAFRLYYGDPGAGVGLYASGLSVKPAPKDPIDGPRHWMIENAFYRVETYPKSGQIWHIWDKQGANQMWWFKEWPGHDKDKGGDPIDWAPNAWVAYPDRVNPGDPSNPDRGKKVFTELLDWHYVIGWTNPQTEIIRGPLFYQIRRWGPVPPHPEHTDPAYDRPAGPIAWAEDTYRFYAGLPWYFQSSTYMTLSDMDVYFIRNNQMVFKIDLFSHLAIRPETPGLLPGDRDEACIFPLMGHFSRLPFGRGEAHSLSNLLPSKLGYYSLFNPETGDGYANFPILEKDSMTTGGEPTMRNHHVILTEGDDWVAYLGRTFDYSNRRYNPENVTFLPKGQRFEEKNVHLMYHYAGPQSLAALENWYETFKHPLVTSWISTPP
jgi:hypothetical protein